MANRNDTTLATKVFPPADVRESVASKLRAASTSYRIFPRPKNDAPIPECSGSGIGNGGGLEGVREFCQLKVEHLAWK